MCIVYLDKWIEYSCRVHCTEYSPQHTACDVLQEEDGVYFVSSEHFLAFLSYKEMPLSVVQTM